MNSQLLIVDQDSAADVDEAVDVVSVGVREYDFRDVVEVEAGGGQGRRELLLRANFHARERDVPRRRGFASVDESQESVVLNRPAVDR